MPDPFPWSRLIEARRAFRKECGDFWSLGLVRKSEALAASVVPAGGRVLDVGAGDRSLEDVLRGLRPRTRR